ncbi:MAG: DUF6231 family protein [Thiobacillus sp.]
MNWHNTLAQALRSVPAGDVCALDVGAQGVAIALLSETRLQHCDALSSTHRAQLVLVKDTLHDLDAAQARALLARARDFIAPRIIVIADAHCALMQLDFLALGYETLAADPAAQITLYQFDLATYKHVPDWLNARFWAHPERWKP